MAGNDQDFVLGAMSNTNPCAYMGHSLLDRTDQFSFGFVLDVPYNFQFSIISHFDSPLPMTLVSDNGGPSPGQIYNTDFSGDGTVDDPMPRAPSSALSGRGIPASYINNVISGYNAYLR